MKKSLVPLKVLAKALEVTIQFVLQQIRQRCTVRQDFESPLYTSDQLRLYKKKTSPLLPRTLPLRGSWGAKAHKVTSESNPELMCRVY